MPMCKMRPLWINGGARESLAAKEEGRRPRRIKIKDQMNIKASEGDERQRERDEVGGLWKSFPTKLTEL